MTNGRQTHNEPKHKFDMDPGVDAADSTDYIFWKGHIETVTFNTILVGQECCPTYHNITKAIPKDNGHLHLGSMLQFAN